MDNRWLRTFTGRRVDYDRPSLESIDINDIAHSLSHLCRYNGHTLLFYSVAQHSCIVQDILRKMNVSDDVLFYGLMHDAHEAYIGDMISPLKRTPELKEGFKLLDRKFMLAIECKFNLVRNNESNELIKLADEIALATEMRDVTSKNDYEGDCMPMTAKIIPCSQEKAKLMFLTRYIALRGETYKGDASA